MKRFGVLIACLFLTSLAVPSLSSAQSRPQTREGFFIGFGLGYGSLGCSTCNGGRKAGGILYLKLGGTVNERVLLGLEGNIWSKWQWPPAGERAGVTLTSNILAAVIQFYPSAESGLFLKGGAGPATLDVGGSPTIESGFGFIGGLGFDARVGSNFSVSPYANYVYASINEEGNSVFQIGLGVMWH